MVSRALSIVRPILALAAAFVIAGLVPVSSAYADHTTRATEIQENGINPWIMGLTIGVIVVSLVAFAAAVLIWEGRDRPADPTTTVDKTRATD